MSTGLKVFLWVVLVFNAITAITSVGLALVLPILWLTVILEVILITGVVMLLFTQKKMGFYIMCGAAVLGCVINVINGNNIIIALISGAVMPGIIYLLMKPNWNEYR